MPSPSGLPRARSESISWHRYASPEAQTQLKIAGSRGEYVVTRATAALRLQRQWFRLIRRRLRIKSIKYDAMIERMRESGLIAMEGKARAPVSPSSAGVDGAATTPAHVLGVLHKLSGGLTALGDGATVSVPVMLTLLSTVAASVEKLNAPPTSKKTPEPGAVAAKIRAEQHRQLQHELHEQQQIGAALRMQLAEDKHAYERQIEKLRLELISMVRPLLLMASSCF